MTRGAGNARWALSFADLCLLLLGFFVLLQARPDRQALAQGLRSAFGTPAPASVTWPAERLFEPGEALLTADARARIAAFARRAGGGAITIASRGTERGAARFDGWELAAARTAAVARALGAAGVGEARIRLAIDPATGGGQTIRLAAG